MNEVKWALYAEMKGASSPILLNPLTWRNGNQIDNLEKILEFFKRFSNVADPKTKILIYKSMCGSGKCCGEDTLILTSKGMVRIEDIVKERVSSQKSIEESFIENTSNDDNRYIGSYVKSLNVNNTKLDDDIISNVLDMGESDILEISTKAGFNIKCTPTHKLIVIDDNCNVVFKDAKDISIGDNIAIVSDTNIYGEDIDITGFYQSDYYRKYKRGTGYQLKLPNKMNEDLAEFLGYVISEGYRKNDMQIVTYNDQQIIRDRIRIIMNKFGISAHEGYDYRRDMNDRVDVDSKMFNDFISYLGYKDYSENKEIPWSILQSSKKIHTAFLRALFSGDGHISDPDNEGSCRIQYYTKSKKLAEHIHVMLLNMGIFSYLSERIRDIGVQQHVTIYGKEDIKKYIDDIGFIQDYKKLRCIDVLNILDERSSRNIRTVKNVHIRLMNIYEEFKKLAKRGKIIETWQEDMSVGDNIWKINRSKNLSAIIALKNRGVNGTNQINGVWGTSKRQLLKLLKAMKECYYMEDFRYLYNIATSNIEFDTIEEKKEGRCHVYDLTIRDNHSYVGNGFINHNSATLLHLIENMGRGIIVVPFRNLQRQYYDDYFTGKNKFVIKKNGNRLSVAVMLGRGNFQCKWLEEQYDYQQMLIEESKKPENYGRIIPIDTNIINMYKADSTCANRYLPCSRPLMSVGSRKEPRWSVASTCLHPFTDILTPNGLKKIKDIKIGDKIYSAKISNGEINIELDTVTNKKKNHTDSLIRFYNTRTGCDIRITHDHIMIYKRNSESHSIYESPASELIQNLTDHVVFIKPNNIIHDKDYIAKIKIGQKFYDTNDFLALLGWYISEGWMTKKDVSLLIHSNQEYDLYLGNSTIRARYSYCKISQCPTENNDQFDEIANLLDKMNIRHYFDGYWSFVITDSDMANALIYYGGKRSKDKFIHKDIFDCSKEQLMHLFKSLIKGDGTIICEENFASYRYKTISRNLTDDIIFLSNILGYRATRSSYLGQYVVYISNIQDKYTGSIKIDMLNYSGDVYDLEVEKNHNYFAGDNGKFILVHNCQYWIPTPTAKTTIDKWKDKIIDERKMNAGFMEDESEGVNKPDIDRTTSDINKNAGTQLDYIQDRIKCHRIEYYDSVGWDQAGIFIRDEVDENGKPCPPVCEYYKQFYAYTQADCIVMNDAKWEIETNIGRKPKINIEIVDEGDYWLDNRSMSLEFSRFMIDKMMPVTNRMHEMKRNTLFLFDTAFQNIKKKIAEPTEEMKEKGVSIISSKDYRELFIHIMNMVLEYKKSVEEDDATLQKMVDLATVLRYIEKASISIEEGKREEFKTIKVFIPYPDNLLKELFKKSSENIIITSGTIHSNFVLSNLFGINNENYIVEFVEGRKESPGKLKCIKPNLLRVNYTSWQSPEFRKVYNNTMNYILDQLKIRIDQITGKPGEGKILVLTPAKKYAEGIIDRQDLFVDFAKSKSEDDGIKPSINTSLTDFMEKSIEDVRKIKPTDIEIDGDVLRTNKQIIVSTRMIRGADLRDNKCRAIVMTKWPMGDVSAGYNQALKLRFGDKTFWSIMRDKAERDAIQYVSRGLRHDWDWEFFSTPDEDAFNRVYMLFTYD